MARARDAEEIQLTLGSTFRVTSLGSRDEKIETRGVFKGIVSVGTVDAVAMELDASHGDQAGKLRVIPSHVVLAIDVLEAAAKEEKVKEDLNVHYS